MFQLRVVIAPSGFKESLSAEQAAAAIAAGVRKAYTSVEIVALPLVEAEKVSALPLST
jgi:glycerate kinase